MRRGARDGASGARVVVMDRVRSIFGRSRRPNRLAARRGRPGERMYTPLFGSKCGFVQGRPAEALAKAEGCATRIPAGPKACATAPRAGAPQIGYPAHAIRPRVRGLCPRTELRGREGLLPRP